ncbi:MAG: ChbG/HpnK family deacetylase [Spirochaetales bacterium]|nr:ChbG/HpnK family deacetylase [Spirochaetales bacterium]
MKQWRKIKRWIVLCIITAAFAAFAAAPYNTSASPPATLDDIPKGQVVLIVNGDDVGMGPMYTDVTIEAYAAGKITSLSIIAPASDTDRAIGLLKARPGLDVGVHLTLTGDWKPLTEGPSLRRKSGQMWDSSAQAAKNVKPEEAKDEWDAQVKRILDSGLTVSHLDSHMGCYFLSDELFKAAAEVSRTYRIPLVSPYWPGRMPPEWRSLFPLASYSGIYTLSVPETLENRAAAYREKIDGLTPGVHYVFTHHAKVKPNIRLHGDLALRVNETAFWTNDETAKMLKERGIILSGCMPLKRQFEKALADL